MNATNGNKIWNYTTTASFGGLGSPFSSSPIIVDNVVYVGSGNGNVYALNAINGDKIWNYPTGSKALSSPAFADGVLYIGSGDGNVYALRVSSTVSPSPSVPEFPSGVIILALFTVTVALVVFLKRKKPT